MTEKELPTKEIMQGDCIEVMKELPAESVHAIVTDPPYGLAFMGKSWDDFKPKEYQEFTEEWAREALRVLKPGGHLLAFSGNRTHHRAFVGIEDAGYTLYDTLTWHYGEGFPKGREMGKSIDKRKGVEREVVGTEEVDVGMQSGNMRAGREQEVVEREKTVATSPEAKKWDGWNTALKPATEFISLARKPVEDTITGNVLEYETGALNIDGCRIDTRENTQDRGAKTKVNTYGEIDVDACEGAYPESLGCYPANVVFDARAARFLDENAETTRPWGANSTKDDASGSMFGISGGVNNEKWRNDSGGASRFFYTAKASKSERTLNGKIDNPHPTVKPADLMEWLIKLVTRENQVVLDPFAGSGTTLRAAKELNREWLGIERKEEWVNVAKARVGLKPDNPEELIDDAAQTTLDV